MVHNINNNSLLPHNVTRTVSAFTSCTLFYDNSSARLVDSRLTGTAKIGGSELDKTEKVLVCLQCLFWFNQQPTNSILHKIQLKQLELKCLKRFRWCHGPIEES